jgi:predicted nucleotidyltransferase
MNALVAPIEDSELRRVVDVIVAEFAPSQVILFGSQARGEARPDSDFDVLVVMPDGTHRLRTGQAIYEALSKLRGRARGVDVVVVTDGEFERGAADLGSVTRAAHREGRALYRSIAVPVG